ncbi:hypothetical protein C5167_033840 [Papaver somniferum]|uniref:Pentatricopeptide repeat-containing protein n=1 Tax=Papaver somniferum TaxID=3469 RepID=A0A4Y7KFG0_PAPSO|nr:hypothetical protein C5167_033840 [Papaver somniferum]
MHWQALVKFQSSFSVPEAHSLVYCNSKTTSYSKNEGLDFQLLFNGYELGNPYFVNSVVSTCAKLGDLYLGKQVHSTIIKLGFNCNVFIGSALVDMYCKCVGIPYPLVTVTCDSTILQLSCSPRCVKLQSDLGELGVQVHGLGIKTGNFSNVVAGTTLIDMYAKCFSVEESRKVFDQMPEKNVITWSSMVSVYAQSHQPDEAIFIAKKMRSVGVKLNEYLYSGKQVHGQVVKEGLESNKYLVATLLTMYSECESSEDFYKMCPTISMDDQISWNSVIAGFSRLGNGNEVLDWFIRMRQACIHIDFFTFANVLRATGILSALSEEPDVVSWNSLISGNSQNGYGEEAVELFEKMRGTGIKPNHTTFLSVLSACSHVGFLEKGVQYFDLMRRGDSIDHPSLEHYGCMVDLFSRAGHLEEAESFINSMPIMPGPSVYKALLSACRFHGNVDIAMRSAKSLLELCPNDPATYVLLSSILAQGGHWVDAADVRSLMRERAVENNPGPWV